MDTTTNLETVTYYRADGGGLYRYKLGSYFMYSKGIGIWFRLAVSKKPKRLVEISEEEAEMFMLQSNLERA